MLDALFKTSAWHHTDCYSNCDVPNASHHYFDASWDLAFERAQANSQCKHETDTRKSAHDLLSNPEISNSKGAHSTSPVQVPLAGALPLRMNGHSDSLARSPTAPDPKGAVFSDVLPEDDNSTDPLDYPMRSFDKTAELATQYPSISEASPLPVSARTPFGDDTASPELDDTVPIVSQLSSIHLPTTRFDSPTKRVQLN
jgi:hypothetical protein